jgi:Ras GTPase-activating-like protein IQGAP2/3
VARATHKLTSQVKYPDALDEDLTPAVARTFLLPFIMPALIAPESWGITDQPIGPNERRNLAALANLVGYIAYPDAEAADPTTKAGDRFVRVPLQEYIRTESATFRDWVMDGMSPRFNKNARGIADGDSC